MLPSARSHATCPGCRSLLVSLLSNGASAGRPRAHLSNPLLAKPALYVPPSTYVRTLSTTRSRRQDVRHADPSPEADDVPPLTRAQEIEKLVRQTRHAFGSTLPKDYLNEEEYKVYERLYGPPLRETQPEDVGMSFSRSVLEEAPHVVHDPTRKILYREKDDGELEEIAYHVEPTTSAASPEAEDGLSPEEIAMLSQLPSDAGMEYIEGVAKNQREYDVLIKLQKDFETAALEPMEDDIEQQEIPEEEEAVEEDEEEDDSEPDARFQPGQTGQGIERVHPYSKMGLWKTTPSTVQLPKEDFVNPITELLHRTDIKHVKEAAEKNFGGPGLPFSVGTPDRVKGVAQKGVALEAGQSKMTEIQADAYIASNLPGQYASVMSILVEIRKRLGPEWLRGLLKRGNGEGPRVLDAGGAGAGLAAWQEILETEWELLKDEGQVTGFDPPGKKTVIVGSTHLRHRVSRFLHNTTFLPRLPDYLHSGDHPAKMEDSKPQSRKTFDIIIASHLLMPLREGHRRRYLLDNLWEMLSPEGGILIFIEKAHPRGFEAVADTRSRLINEFIETVSSDPRPQSLEVESRREREPGHILAPCTNHKECPMYLVPGLSHGRKDFCHFRQRFIRPPFLQKILDASHRNHGDIDFSYIAVQRGTPSTPTLLSTSIPEQGRAAADTAFKGFENSPEPPHALSLPRSILPPLKRHGHVTMDVCTPAATIERWTIPKSFSKQAYHDARKSSWGDLWALGAKTRVVRPVRLGKAGTTGAPNDGGVRARAATSGKKRPKVVNLESGPDGLFREPEELMSRKGRPGERRPKNRGPKRNKKLDPEDE